MASGSQSLKIVVCESATFLPQFLRHVQNSVPNVEVIPIQRERNSVEWQVPNAAKDAEIFVSNPSVMAEMSDHFPKLKWAHSTWAGVETLFSCKQFQNKPDFQITKSGGYFGPMMAEWVIGQIISWERQFRKCYDWQNLKQWGNMGFYRQLSGLSIGILGAGDIGKADHYRTFNGLKDILKSCDFICSILPKTPETDGMLDNQILKCCESKPVFINAGRSNIISEASIIQAIEQNWISGAILDVFSEEPLPTSSPLWSNPQVVISPHCSALSLPKETAEAFIRNYRRFMSGQALEHVVDWEAQY